MANGNLILGRYRPIAEAGAGGFGTVQVAWDTRIQRKVAIKCIELDEVDAARAALPGANAMPSYDQVDWDDVPPWDDLPDPSDIPEFENPFRPDGDLPIIRSLAHIPGLDEARTAAMLTDSNIVTVYDFEVQGQTAYLIMEYIEGITLTKLLRDYADFLTLDTVAAVFSSVAHALEVAHENQVLHLDIKPDNVLINRQGQVKVTDFGLATLADASGFGAAGGGTIGYMPLEQMRGENLDARCDEWALASVTYEMLAGQNPFLAPDLDRAETAIEDAELVLPSLCWDELNPAADDVVFYALDPDRCQRYDNVADFSEEMERFLGEPKRGHRELAVIVGDAQGDDEEETEDEPVPRAPRIPLRERFTVRQAALASRVVSAAGCALLAFVALSNLPQIGGFADAGAPLFWGLFALVTLAGALKPHLGALLAYVALAAAFIAQGAPAAGIVLLAATAVWWYFLGRTGNAEATIALAAPLAGAVGGNQLAPLAAGYFLTPLKALGAMMFSLLLAVLLAALGSGNLLGWDALAYGGFAGTDVQANIGVLLMQPATWCMAASWLAAAGMLAVCRLRATRFFDWLGVVLSSVFLVVGVCATAWFASGQVTWVPSVAAIVPTVLVIAVLLAATALWPPVFYEDEELEAE
ncbi:serine/threonine-protein kinase [Gordonibacter sp.]|uniref:serine/threonine-protein kinase n=1 Tax=Gordonibacter sp. TaxID=1968902 RepID=UPI002FCA9901